jgi:hypothetical protein
MFGEGTLDPSIFTIHSTALEVKATKKKKKEIKKIRIVIISFSLEQQPALAKQTVFSVCSVGMCIT